MRQSPFSPPLSSPLPPHMSRRLPYWEEHPSPGSAMASLLGFPTNLNLQRGVPPLSLLIHSTSPTPTGTFSNGSLPHLSWLGSLVFLPILAPEPTGYATRQQQVSNKRLFLRQGKGRGKRYIGIDLSLRLFAARAITAHHDHRCAHPG